MCVCVQSNVEIAYLSENSNPTSKSKIYLKTELPCISCVHVKQGNGKRIDIWCKILQWIMANIILLHRPSALNLLPRIWWCFISKCAQVIIGHDLDHNWWWRYPYKTQFLCKLPWGNSISFSQNRATSTETNWADLWFYWWHPSCCRVMNSTK